MWPRSLTILKLFTSCMNIEPLSPASIGQPTPDSLALSGAWNIYGISTIEKALDGLNIEPNTVKFCDGANVSALDTAGAWLLQKLLQRLNSDGAAIEISNLKPEFAKLFSAVLEQVADQVANEAAPAASTSPPSSPSPNSPSLPTSPPTKPTPQKKVPSIISRVGKATADVAEQGIGLINFTGEVAIVFATSALNPKRIRWRPILFNLRTAGFDALPIVGLLAFLLGIVVAYQGADQLRQYGANIFVADLVGVSMLREFSPLITAIIIAGRSGSAYAAQIGTMAVTEEIDAMRTIGIAPLELLVLPKVIALMIAMPLLTVFADALGVFGGMLMARSQLDVGFAEFLERFVKAVHISTYLVGVGKAPVFAAIIVLVGCFQGFKTKGGADSVGRQTTRSVVQSIFLVIVADALFSVIFSALDL